MFCVLWLKVNLGQMIKIIKQLIIKYKELILYTIFGCITTFINIITFSIMYKRCKMPLLFSNSLAWTIAFTFSFISNKLWVFESKGWKSMKALKEVLGFFLTRLTTLLLDTLTMWILVDMMKINSLISKISSNLIMILLNYIASKFLIFNVEKEP